MSTTTHDSPGPSSNDIDKISTIEAITLEYSYLLSSQLEAMRQHYEATSSSTVAQLSHLQGVEDRAAETESARVQADTKREEAETKASRAEKKAEKAAELSRSLQASLSAERAMTNGLSDRIKAMSAELERLKVDKATSQGKLGDMEELVKGFAVRFGGERRD